MIESSPSGPPVAFSAISTAHQAVATAPAALKMRRVAKSFNGRTVLDLDALVIRPGEVHALLGQNGSGKSTLIKVLSGYHNPDPDAGTAVTVAGVRVPPGSQDLARAAGLRFVHQDLALVGEMSILDNIYLGRSYPTRGWTVRPRMAGADALEALARVGLSSLDPSRPIASLSPAERTGVAIARALAADVDRAPTVLVLDEPTATLPGPEVDRLLGTLRGVAEAGVAILYVTHHLDEVFTVADAVSILRDGREVASGRTTSFNREQLVHHLVGSELEALHRHAPDIDNDGGVMSTDAVMLVRGLAADRIHNMSFSVAPGEVIGFHGVTGSGRDAVLGALFGALDRSAGTVTVGGTELPAGRPDLAIHLGLGFVPPDRKAHGCLVGLSARENLTLPALKSFWRRGRLSTVAEDKEARDWFSRLDIRPVDGTNLPLSSFSGGNQQKIVLAKWLRQKPAVLLLDEPTQGVDVGAKAVIHRTILDGVAQGLAVLIASSDDEELAALCTKVHVVQHGRIVDTLIGEEITEAHLSRQLNAISATEPAPTTGMLS